MTATKDVGRVGTYCASRGRHAVARRILLPVLLLPSGCLFFGTELAPCVDADNEKDCDEFRDDDSGGSAGGVSGSDSSGGGGGTAPELPQLRRDLHLNELYHGPGGYVELYNSSNGEVSLEGVGVATAPQGQSQPDYATVCDLSSARSLIPNGFLVAQVGTSCLIGECFLGCVFEFGEGATIFLLKLSEGSWQTVDAQQYSSPLPVGGTSLQASPDGSSNFSEAAPTPGTSNGN